MTLHLARYLGAVLMASEATLLGSFHYLLVVIWNCIWRSHIGGLEMRKFEESWTRAVDLDEPNCRRGIYSGGVD